MENFHYFHIFDTMLISQNIYIFWYINTFNHYLVKSFQPLKIDATRIGGALIDFSAISLNVFVELFEMASEKIGSPWKNVIQSYNLMKSKDLLFLKCYPSGSGCDRTQLLRRSRQTPI